MPTLTRDQILGAEDLARESVDVPEWGGQVFVRMMSGEERDEFDQALVAKASGTNANNLKVDVREMRARLCSLTICDEKGQLLFSRADVAALGKKSGAALQRVFDAAQKLNKINGDAVKSLEKN
ncbi:Phage tail assembly chaperone [Planctomycetes bacterium Pan216]|uniref:Phage tail assembly chaperone n=1 Tax=Kolteria novifilia TaxID=2527975 RepID=A0A518B5E5_9BACT|nr:Phage tail assembly chaperone [Planctomycetes bacterium Pan216]